MLDVWQMIIRLGIAMALGSLMGLERELAGKKAGIKTTMLVSAGAAMFSMVSLMIPFSISTDPDLIRDLVTHNSGFLALIANIVVGVGFIGAGIILKTSDDIHNLTTAALVWTVAAIGISVGLGLIKFSVIATFIISGVLYLMRESNIERDRLLKRRSRRIKA